MERQLDATTADFLAAFISKDVERQLKPYEFTIADYRAEYFKQTGQEITKSSAETRLNKLEREGKIIRRDNLAFHNGRDVIAYRMADGEEF